MRVLLEVTRKVPFARTGKYGLAWRAWRLVVGEALLVEWNGKAADRPYPREYGGLGDELAGQGFVKIATRSKGQLGEGRIEFCYR